MNYIELHVRSAFSFLEGASVPEELIAVALGLEMPAMALLDRDGVYGSPRFHLAAKKNGIKAHIGAEITVRSADKVQSRKSNARQASGRWTLDIGLWTKRFAPHAKHVFDSASGPQSYGLSESLSANNVDEVACAQTCEARRVCNNS